jgi:hypothetical protein
MVGLPVSPLALDFDVAIMLRGLYEERAARDRYMREREHGQSTDAESLGESVVI